MFLLDKLEAEFVVRIVEYLEKVLGVVVVKGRSGFGDDFVKDGLAHDLGRC